MHQTQGLLNEGMSSRQRFLTQVSAVRSESDLFQMEAKKISKKSQISTYHAFAITESHQVPPSPCLLLRCSPLSAEASGI